MSDKMQDLRIEVLRERGWDFYYSGDNQDYYGWLPDGDTQQCPHYESDISAAMGLLVSLGKEVNIWLKDDGEMCVSNSTYEGVVLSGWEEGNIIEATGPFPEAACRFYLKAKEYLEQQ